MTVGFYHNSTICTECKSCQIACKDIHDLDAATNLRKVSCYEGGAYPNPWVYFLSIACNHCESPACLANCPVGAISKMDDGTVVIDEGLCIGCQTCLKSCPYGAPKFIKELGISKKCDGCLELRKEGKNPACVDSCLMRALEFGDIDDLRAAHSTEKLTADLPPLPSSTETSPNLLINAKEIASDKNYTSFGVQ